ncbi:MAG: hypothetical protein EXR58_07460 [Chloroflexi bacterium]|nr:hypothetical protein [Chloroflexota bacterium]
MAPNWIDIAILVVVAWNIASAVRQGFVSSLVSLLAFLSSISIAIIAYVRVADWSVEKFGVPALIAQPIAFGLLWPITGFLINVVGRFVAAPFSWLLHGSPLNLLLSILPGGLKGFAVCGFVLMLVMAPPPLPLGVPGAAFAQLRDAMQSSQLAGDLLERTSAYDRWARRLLEEPVAQTLNLLTVPPGGGERIDLNFRTDIPTLDELAETRMLELLNQERGKDGLSTLLRDPGIDAVARAHSVDMLAQGYFAHETPSGVSPFDRLLQTGIRFRDAGENIALAPTVEIAHQGLMESPEHRANILNPDFNRVGLGVFKADGMGRIFTQDFAN